MAPPTPSGPSAPIIIADHGPLDPALPPDQIKTAALPFVQAGFVVPD
jgi:hypothetical protein